MYNLKNQFIIQLIHKEGVAMQKIIFGENSLNAFRAMRASGNTCAFTLTPEQQAKLTVELAHITRVYGAISRAHSLTPNDLRTVVIV